MGLVTRNLFYVALSYVLARIAGTIAYALLLRRKSPWIVLGFKHVDRKTIKALFKPGLGFMAFPLGYALNLQGFTILIGVLLGPLAVTSFSTWD